MRKAFNFFNSYWQTANELSDKDRLSFYDALFHYQFTGDKSKLEQLNGMAKFAFISQAHSIENQINGYYDICKRHKIKAFDNPTIPPTIGATLGATVPPTLQEKGKGKGKGKVKEEEFFLIPAFEDFKNHAVEKEKSIDVVELKKKYDAWVNNDWHDGNGQKIKNWKSKLNSTIPYIKKNQAINDYYTAKPKFVP